MKLPEHLEKKRDEWKPHSGSGADLALAKYHHSMGFNSCYAEMQELLAKEKAKFKIIGIELLEAREREKKLVEALKLFTEPYTCNNKMKVARTTLKELGIE